MASQVTFFAPDTSILGALTDWEIQTGGNPSISRSRAQCLKANGDELAAVQYGTKVEYSFTLKPKTFTGTAYTFPNVGEILGGAHIDSLSLAYTQADFPTLTVNAHRHCSLDGTTNTHDACRIYVPSVVLPPRSIGVPSTLKDADGTAIFTMPEGVGMRSLTYSLAVSHIDEDDGEGEHLAGQNHDGVETLSIELTGEVEIADLNLSSAWMLPESSSLSQSSTAATTTSLTLSRHISYDTTKTPSGAEH